MTAPVTVQDTPGIMNANWNALPTDISEENPTSIVWSFYSSTATNILLKIDHKKFYYISLG